MRYIKPDYYDEFVCVAGDCPDTCCAGWQIMIDEESLEKYSEVKGNFGRRLVNSIDWQEGCFYQYERRCAFLNEENLCDLYTALGAEALCHTCRNYPRHTEEYEGLRELSLSLSCPIAAKMILLQEKFPVFAEYEDDRAEELAEEFEDFDLLMFTQLEDARTAVLRHLKESKGCLEEKMEYYLQFARDMQACIDAGEYFEVDSVIRGFEQEMLQGVDNEDISCVEMNDEEADLCKKAQKVQNIGSREKSARYMHRMELYLNISELERLREEWSEVLNGLNIHLYEKGEAHYWAVSNDFEDFLAENPSAEKQWENIGLQLFVFFLYTYFCGAVYDDRIYSKMALAVESVRFIRELYLFRWLEKGCLEAGDYVELAYRYAREIEHSDLNLEAMEDFLEKTN